MARKVLVLEEVVAMLQVVGASPKVIEKFAAQAEGVIGKKPIKTLDAISVSSGFGHASERGFVELTLDDLRTQMDAKKAREVGLMLIEAAEAAASDEMFVKLLAQLGLDDPEARGRILLELREIRQGSREIVHAH